MNNKRFDQYFPPNEEEASQKEYLDIWRVNPSYKEANRKELAVKCVFVSIIIGIIYLSNMYPYPLYVLGFFLGLFGCQLFFDRILSMFGKLKRVFGYGFYVQPFRELEIITIDNDPSTLLLINPKKAVNIALRIFTVNILPENVQPTLNQLLKALYNSNIEFTYQVLQTPLLQPIHTTGNTTGNSGNGNLNGKEIPSHITVYFSISHSLNGVLRRSVIQDLIKIVRAKSNAFKSTLVDNVHHTKISLLEGTDLLNALRITTFNPAPNRTTFPQKDLKYSFDDVEFTMKLIFTVFLITMLTVYLTRFDLHLLFILIIDGTMSYVFIFSWWRDILYFFSLRTLKKYSGLNAVDVFPDLNFFRIKGNPSILYANLNNTVLMATQIMNLTYAIQPMLAYPDKFFRALNHQKIYFNYMVFTSPEKQGRKWMHKVNEKTEEFLKKIRVIGEFDGDGKKRPTVKYPLEEFSNWLQMRSGIWKTCVTIGLTCYREIEPSKQETNYYWELRTELSEKTYILKQAFEDNFLQLQLQLLSRTKLLNAFQCSCIKTLDVKDQNSKLRYLYFQGKNLINLIAISNELKKGLETKIAAEFNTPLHLVNDIIIGSTLNTETLEPEVEFGFKLDQIKQLLITNGLFEQREATAMRIVTELVRKHVPCVVFDFSGNWSKLITQFQNADQQNSLLYFKLGTSFSLDLLNSEIPYDNENLEYLNLFYDVFSLAFKADKSAVDLLRLAVARNKGIDLNSIELQEKVEKEIVHREYNSLIALLQGIDEWKRFFTSTPSFSEDESNDGGSDDNGGGSDGNDGGNTNGNPLKAIDFIRNEKTIILDLSLLPEINQKLFASFVIISKFIHYAKYIHDCRPKVLIVPYIDLFFDAYYIDNFRNTMDYGKINKFVAALLEKGFGFILNANQIRYLHANVLNFFPNLITYKATDSRDITVLKSQMNLQELHGSGYYSSKRNNTYQIETLMNLQGQDALVKRADIYQPFPAIIDFERLSEFPKPSEEYLNSYMYAQGYDLKDQEAYILAGIKKTLFEKDLGIFAEFTDDIIKFLFDISSVDNVGGLTETRLKTELFKYIKHTASKRVKERVKIDKIRNNLFQILITHKYLIEAHPNRASGGQNIRTCYKVGPKYKHAVDDYYDSKPQIPIKEPLDLNLDTQPKSNPTQNSSQNPSQNSNRNSNQNSNRNSNQNYNQNSNQNYTQKLNQIPKKNSAYNSSNIDLSTVKGKRKKIQEVLYSQPFQKLVYDAAVALLGCYWNLLVCKMRNKFEELIDLGLNALPTFFSTLQNGYNQMVPDPIYTIDDTLQFAELLIEEHLIPCSKQYLHQSIRSYNAIIKSIEPAEPTKPINPANITNIEAKAEELIDLYDDVNVIWGWKG